MRLTGYTSPNMMFCTRRCIVHVPASFHFIVVFSFQDIQLGGLGILHEHCQLDIEGNEVNVTPLAKTG